MTAPRTVLAAAGLAVAAVKATNVVIARPR